MAELDGALKNCAIPNITPHDKEKLNYASALHYRAIRYLTMKYKTLLDCTPHD